MKFIQIRLPNRIHERIKKLARADEIIRQETRDFFRDAAASFDVSAFAEALSTVPDCLAAKKDRISVTNT